MGTPNVIVGSTQAACLMQNNHDPIVISNDGPNVVYLDDAPSVNPLAYDYALQPGDCVAWIENVPCYAICATSQTASVTISLNVRIFGGVRLYSPSGVQAQISGGAVSTGTGTDGNTYQYNTFNSTSTLTINKPGGARVLVIGGGGGGGVDGGGGAGGYVDTDFYFGEPFRTWNVTVGAGGATAALGINGSPSIFGPFYVLGGGGGASSVAPGNSGGSGGGAGRGGIGGPADDTYGPVGYSGTLVAVSYGYNTGGGGAGSNAYATGAGPGGTNAQGGDGRQWIDGVYRAGGGGGSAYLPIAVAYRGSTASYVAGAANSGAGGGALAAGGSGVIIIATRI